LIVFKLYRWWTVGETAKFVIKHFNVLLEGAIEHRNANKSETKVNKIASQIISLMNESTIISDLYLIEAYCSFFLDKHFAWMQKGDKFVGGEPGYISRHLAVRYFIMQSDLSRGLKNKWKILDEFRRFNSYNVNCLPVMDRKAQEHKTNMFFSMAKSDLDKHFKRWVNELFVYALFSEKATAQCAATALRGMEGTHQRGHFYSKIHNEKIDLSAFENFLLNKKQRSGKFSDIAAVRENFHIKEFGEVNIKFLAEGGDIWNGESLLGSSILNYFFNNYAAVLAHTHSTEAGVKEGNYTTKKGRHEQQSSDFVALRSGSLHDINMRTKINQESNQLQQTGKGYKNPKDVKRKGKLKIEAALSVAMEVTDAKDLLLMRKDPIWSAIREGIKEGSEVNRNGMAKDKFDELKKKERNANRVEKQSGYHHTPFMKGEVQYGKTTKQHMPLYIDECQARGISTEGVITITALKNLVKTDEGNGMKSKFFKPKSDHDLLVWYPMLENEDI
jgi:hypothetical protein